MGEIRCERQARMGELRFLLMWELADGRIAFCSGASSDFGSDRLRIQRLIKEAPVVVTDWCSISCRPRSVRSTSDPRPARDEHAPARGMRGRSLSEQTTQQCDCVLLCSEGGIWMWCNELEEAEDWRNERGRRGVLIERWWARITVARRCRVWFPATSAQEGTKRRLEASHHPRPSNFTISSCPHTMETSSSQGWTLRHVCQLPVPVVLVKHLPA